MGCHFLLQGILSAQELNPHLLHGQADCFFYQCTTWEAAIVNSYSILKKNFFKKENRQVNLKMSLCTLSRTIKKFKNQMYISTFTERYLFIQVGQMSQSLEPKA